MKLISTYKDHAIHAIHNHLEQRAIDAQQADSIEAILEYIDDDSLIEALLTVNDIEI